MPSHQQKTWSDPLMSIFVEGIFVFPITHTRLIAGK